MEEEKENFTFKSLNQEDLFARPDDKMEYLCTASECIFPRYLNWLKLKTSHEYDQFYHSLAFKISTYCTENSDDWLTIQDILRIT